MMFETLRVSAVWAAEKAGWLRDVDEEVVSDFLSSRDTRFMDQIALATTVLSLFGLVLLPLGLLNDFIHFPFSPSRNGRREITQSTTGSQSPAIEDSTGQVTVSVGGHQASLANSSDIRAARARESELRAQISKYARQVEALERAMATDREGVAKLQAESEIRSKAITEAYQRERTALEISLAEDHKNLAAAHAELAEQRRLNERESAELARSLGEVKSLENTLAQEREQAAKSRQQDVFDFSIKRTFPLQASADALAISEDGRLILVASADAVRLLTADSGSLKNFGPPIIGRATVAAMSRDGSWAAIGGHSGLVQVINIEGGKSSTFRISKNTVSAIAIGTQATLAVAAEDDSVEVWDMSNAKLLRRLPNPTGKIIRFLTFRNRGAALTGVSQTGMIVDWDAKTARVLRELRTPGGGLTTAAVSSTANLLALSTDVSISGKVDNPFNVARPADIHSETSIKIYDLTSGSLLKQIAGFGDNLRALSISGDGQFIAYARGGVKRSDVVLYDLKRGVEVASFPSEGAPIAAFSADGGSLFTTSNNKTLLALAIAPGQAFASAGDLRGQRFTITSGATAPLLIPPFRTTVAVLDFQANGVDRSTSQAMAELLRSRLADASNITVIDRATIENVFREQSFQLSDRTDSATAVQIGRLLGVRKIILGSVSRLGGNFTIDARVLDEETGLVDGERSVSCRQCSVDDLPEAISLLGTAIVGPKQR